METIKTQILFEYKVLVTDQGEWYHGESTNYIFTYVKDDWPDKVKKIMKKAFQKISKIPSLVKAAVEK
jgi:hypothetical protein